MISYGKDTTNAEVARGEVKGLSKESNLRVGLEINPLTAQFC